MRRSKNINMGRAVVFRGLGIRPLFKFFRPSNDKRTTPSTAPSLTTETCSNENHFIIVYFKTSRTLFVSASEKNLFPISWIESIDFRVLSVLRGIVSPRYTEMMEEENK